MDQYLVANAQFQKFVKETEHVTLAERPANPDHLSDFYRYCFHQNGK
ncbi:MAG: hypothetical protein JOZ78_27545 [Chroococcidiopsidaceae cyanobacterium CP_BM_ER_R8_30]|nr:hypothetical protein [Chroococcidiopsidaceae cyanobacterium CP_BM_ER_R8_30]